MSVKHRKRPRDWESLAHMAAHFRQQNAAQLSLEKPSADTFDAFLSGNKAK